MKLNLGCGGDVREGYANIDILGGPNVIKADLITYLVAAPSNIADKVMLKDVLEHFSHGFVEDGDKIVHSDIQPGVFELLHLVMKVLKPQGELYIRVPDFDWIIDKWLIWKKDGGEADEQMDFARLNWTLCGEIRNGLHDGHHSIWTKYTLVLLLERIGYKVTEVKSCEPNFEVTAMSLKEK